MGNNVTLYALKDISDYVKEEVLPNYHPKYEPWVGESWVVSAKHLQTKDTRNLNKELGISGINKIGNTNGHVKWFKNK